MRNNHKLYKCNNNNHEMNNSTKSLKAIIDQNICLNENQKRRNMKRATMGVIRNRQMIYETPKIRLYINDLLFNNMIVKSSYFINTEEDVLIYVVNDS